MARCAIVNTNTNKVENVIRCELDYDPGPGKLLIQSDTAAPGWDWDGNVLTGPAPTSPSAEDIRQSQFAAETQVQSIINQLRTMSAAEIDAWFATNVTNAAQAINVLRGVVKVLAYKLRH